MDVKSEVGKGTEVTVCLPLTRLPGSASAISTPSSVTTDGSGGDPIELLRSDYGNTTVELLGFRGSMMEPVLKEIVEGWYGLRLFQSSQSEKAADVVIVDEQEVLRSRRQGRFGPPTIVLCTNDSRTAGVIHHDMPVVTEFISKPIGPHKLAKAVHLCLERAKGLANGLDPALALSNKDSAKNSETSTVIPELGNLTLETNTESHPLELRGNESVLASGSSNALMAIDKSSLSNDTSGNETVTGNDAFPFPSQDSEEGERLEENDDEVQKVSKRADLVRRDSRRPAITSRVTEPIVKIPFLKSSQEISDKGTTFPVNPPDEYGASQRGPSKDTGDVSRLTASNMALHNGETPPESPPKKPQEKRLPRLLLVDDNKINLRLLETFMRKRKFEYVDSAENGLLAVQAAEAHELGYDIIFMGEFSSFLIPIPGLRSPPHSLSSTAETSLSYRFNSRSTSLTSRTLQISQCL